MKRKEIIRSERGIREGNGGKSNQNSHIYIFALKYVYF